MADILGLNQNAPSSELPSLLEDAIKELKDSSFAFNDKNPLFAMRPHLLDSCANASPNLSVQASPLLFGDVFNSPAIYPQTQVNLGIEELFSKNMTTNENDPSLVDDFSFQKLLNEVISENASSTPLSSDTSPVPSMITASPQSTSMKHLSSPEASLMVPSPELSMSLQPDNLMNMNFMNMNLFNMLTTSPVLSNSIIPMSEFQTERPKLATEIKTPYMPPNTLPTQEEYQCPHPNCNKKFITMRLLIAHQLSHKNERPHACDHCNARFRRIPDLQRHIRSMHSQEKPYVCPHGCGKSYPRSDALKRHLTIKSKAKAAKFGCPVLQSQVNYDQDVNLEI